MNIFTALSIGELRKYILVLYTNYVVYLIFIPKALSEINTAFVEQEVVHMRLREHFSFLHVHGNSAYSLLMLVLMDGFFGFPLSSSLISCSDVVVDSRCVYRQKFWEVPWAQEANSTESRPL